MYTLYVVRRRFRSCCPRLYMKRVSAKDAAVQWESQCHPVHSDRQDTTLQSSQQVFLLTLLISITICNSVLNIQHWTQEEFEPIQLGRVCSAYWMLISTCVRVPAISYCCTVWTIIEVTGWQTLSTLHMYASIHICIGWSIYEYTRYVLITWNFPVFVWQYR